jgi:hypothetical protein
MAKGTAVDVELRINAIVKLLANGASRSDVLQYAANTWGLKARQTDDYMARARERLKQDWDINRQSYVAQLMAQLSVVHKKALGNGQLSVALGCINTAARLANIGQ